MIERTVVYLLAAIAGAVGLGLMLPHGSGRARAGGAVLAAVSLGLLASQLPGLGYWLWDAIFYVLAAMTIVGAVATITFRNTVYCAIWFGMSLSGTAALFLFQGAQFLAVATIVVYAGAILVTFLFVLMLAEPSGRARYDRVSWDAAFSAAIGAVLVAILTAALTGALTSSEVKPPIAVTQVERDRNVLAEDHMTHLGSALFGRYLIAVEGAGVLLLAALVGAAAIVGRSRGPLAVPAGHEGGPGSRRRISAPGPNGGDGHA